MINWLSQIFSVTFFNLLTIPERKGAAITTTIGIAGVTAVLVGVLSIAEGFRAAMTVTLSGPPRSFAASTSASQSTRQSASRPAISPISASGTTWDSPSEQRRKLES